MLVLDTEVIFALPVMYEDALKILKMRGLRAPDTAILELQITLRSRGRNLDDIIEAMRVLKVIFRRYGVKEVLTRF